MFSTFKIPKTIGDVNILGFSVSCSLPLHPKLSLSLLLITTTCQPLPVAVATGRCQGNRCSPSGSVMEVVGGVIRQRGEIRELISPSVD